MEQWPSEEQISTAAQKLINRSGWQTVRYGPLVAKAIELRDRGFKDGGGDPVERLCERAAAVLLYGHCERGALASATPAELELERFAYQDLGTYLLAAGGRIEHAFATPPDREDMVQDTLLAIARRFREPRMPDEEAATGTRRRATGEQRPSRSRADEAMDFLALAVTILRRQYFSASRLPANKLTISGDSTNGDNISILSTIAVPASSVMGDPAFTLDEDALLDVVRSCLTDEDQRLVILCLMFTPLTRARIQEYFERLRKSYDYVRRTALKGLRECALFQQYLERLHAAKA